MFHRIVVIIIGFLWRGAAQPSRSGLLPIIPIFECAPAAALARRRLVGCARAQRRVCRRCMPMRAALPSRHARLPIQVEAMSRVPRDGGPNRGVAAELAKEQTGIRDRNGEFMDLYNADPHDFGLSGIGIELFFDSMTMGMKVFGVASVIGAVMACLNVLHHWRHGLSATDAHTSMITIGRWENWCPDGYPTPHGWCSGVLYLQVVLWTVLTLMFIGFLYVFKMAQLRTVAELDERYVTTSDFSLEVREIPSRGRSGEELFAFFSQFGPVHSVTLGYACEDYVRAKGELDDAQIDLLELERTHSGGKKVVAAKERVEEKQAVVDKITRNKPKPTSTAFVTFETSAAMDRCLHAHSTSGFRLMDLCWGKEEQRYKGKKLLVRPAPEPSDVYWENLEITEGSVRARSLFTLFTTIVLLGITVGFLVSVTHYKDRKLDEYDQRIKYAKTAEDAKWDPVWLARMSTLFSLSVAGVIAVVNVLMKLAVHRLAVFEKQNTRTGYEESIFFKLSLAYILNQSLMILFVEPVRNEWFSAGNVMSQALFIMVLNPLVLEPLKLFPPELALNRYVLAPFAKTQDRMNKLYEPPAATVGEFYAGIGKTFALGIIYGPALPVAYPIAVLSLAIAYWANKYSLLRVFRPPPLLHQQINDSFQVLLACIIFASICVQYALVGGNPHGGHGSMLGNLLVTVSLLAFIVYLVAPIRWIIPKFECVRRARARAPDGARTRTHRRAASRRRALTTDRARARARARRGAASTSRSRTPMRRAGGSSLGSTCPSARTLRDGAPRHAPARGGRPCGTHAQPHARSGPNRAPRAPQVQMPDQ